MGLEGLPWYDGRQGRIQRVYHGMLEGRADPEGLPWYAGRQGGSRGFTMVCWKAGRIQRVYHGMMEDRGGSRGFTMV